MAEKLPPRDVVTVEELLISGMYETCALVELLDRKGLLAKREMMDMIQEIRRQTPSATSVAPSIPEPYLDTPTANRLIEQILSLMNEAKMTSHQARTLLDRLPIMGDAGEVIARKTTH